MRALLIVHDVYQDDNHFPLPEGYIASIFSSLNIEIMVYCMDIFHYSLKELADYLRKNSFDFIGVGFLSGRFTETIIPLCKVINKYKDKAWLVLGGHGASATPEFVLNKTNADALVVGEAENAIPEIVDDIQCNNIQGIYHENPVKDLDSIPFPLWDKFPIKKYINSIIKPGMSSNDTLINVLSSRGCVGKCTFCYRQTKGIRTRSMDNLFDELEYLINTYGITYFEFADELFLLSKSRLEDFYCEKQNRNLDFKYWCASRVNIIDEDILRMLKESGCEFINYGFESMDKTVLKEMHKMTTPELNERTAKLTREAGIDMGLNFIWGCPSDTFKTLKQNASFIKKYNTYGQLRTIRPITPYPGCKLYYDAINQGLLEGPQDFYDKFTNSDLLTVNFTQYPKDKIYKELFRINKDLITDHLHHSDMSMKQANKVIKGFRKLYFGDSTTFRGARHYDKS